jgi:O-antigen/teichoic acid export membrane protein
MSSRSLIKSMLIIGSAQMVNIVISILRMKVLAVLLGPAGIGLLSIYNNFREMMVMGAGLGLSSSGVRQIASVKGEAETLSRVRRVLLGALLLQGTLALVVVWMLRERLALWLLDDIDYVTEIGLIGVAMVLTLLAGSQTALLQGLRRIGDLARVTVLGALVGTLAGLLAVWTWGQDGLIWFILVQPLAAILVAHYYTSRVPRPIAAPLSLSGFWQAWYPMARLGIVFMLGGLITTVALLLIRSRVMQELGLDAAGQFAAAWSISMIYVGFLLQSMGADYFPRLTEVINDRDAANRLMNDQMQLALALGGPVLLLLIGLAPWLIRLLYSAEFSPAVTLLQWQTVGNVFKLASWPLGFAFVASAKSQVFLFNQVLWNLIFLSLGWFGLSYWGMDILGVAFLLAYAVGFVRNTLLVRRHFKFCWEALSLWLVAGHGTLALALLALSLTFPVTGMIIAVILAASTGLVGGRIVVSKIGPQGGLASRIARFYAAIGWPIQGVT